MNLTTDQVEARMTAAWGRQAIVVAHRICGNRLTYIATDHKEHWLSLLKSWQAGHQVFEPVGARWPDDPWVDAILEAEDLAHDYFTKQGNALALRRLPRGQVLALCRNWTRLGDEQDTFVMLSQSKGGIVYRANGRCDCPDYLLNGVPGGWCKHRIARALAKRAQTILDNGNGAGGDCSTPAPEPGPIGTNAQTKNSTVQAPRQVELLVRYEADGAGALARIHSGGELMQFKADGQVTDPPTDDLNELYRWLQDHSLVPDMTRFHWLERIQGNRRRKQVYVLDEVTKRDQALPVEHSRGRSKLFKA